MEFRPAITASIVVLSLTACAPQDDAETDDDWVGTITTEGAVTTVVNESGSAWGGTGTLVEEASIGVEAGDDAYMLGSVAGVAATEGRIYVLDAQVPTVRMYDWAGRHSGDFGRGGQGPGEFSGMIMQLGAALDGHVFVALVSKIEVFSPEGDLVDTRTFESGYSISTGSPMTVSADGVPYVADILVQDGPPHGWQWGMIGYGADGPGEPIPAPVFDFEPQSVVLRFRMNNGAIATGSSEPPFAPQAVWALLPDPEMVGGVSDVYAFTRFHADGTTTRIRRETPPIALFADEADWYGRRYQAYVRTTVDPPAWSVSQLATTKPAFEQFIPDYSGRVWVLRPGEGRRLPGCDEAAVEFSDFNAGRCWQDSRILDVFDHEGRFLGDVEIPEGFRFSPRPHLNGDVVVAAVEDEAGTIMVKRYRLVLPGEEGS